MTIHWAVVADPETVVINNEHSLIFSIVFEAFGRDPHEYVRTKTGNKSTGLGATHAPLHRRDRKVFAVKEFFENAHLMQTYSKKINQFVTGSDDIIKVPFADVIKSLAETCQANGGKLLMHCADRDLRAFWYSDQFYGTKLFSNGGPYFKTNPKIKGWNSIKFVCTRRWFTNQHLSEKMKKKYPHLIDTSLEGLVIAIRGNDLSFRQSHRPQDDVDLLIEVLDHVYTANVSKQDFWNLLQMDHDYYDNRPVTIFAPGNTRLCTSEVSVQETLKN